MQVDHLEQLAALLRAEGIPTAQWGVGAAKRVADLWQELRGGETELHGPPLLRVVRGVIRVIVRRGDAILIEAEQVFGDGRTRERNWPPTDKLLPGESYIEAARRCLVEELGVAPSAISVIESSYRREQATHESPSYPGLLTQYVFHTVEAHVARLPPTDFWTDEAASNRGDAVARHRWIWQPQTGA